MISGPLIENIFASDSLARTLARSVFPHPGGPYSNTPLCGSIPSLVNNSGWRNGNSTISRITLISERNPPTSSYVILNFLSSDFSERIVNVVIRSILTTPFGDILLILKSIAFPKIITEISSPWLKGRPFSLFFTKSENSLSTVTASLIGIKVIDLAGFVTIFLISTTSFNPTSIFFLVWPSTLIVSGYFSSSSDGHTIAHVDFFPLICITSPGETWR